MRRMFLAYSVVIFGGLAALDPGDRALLELFVQRAISPESKPVGAPHDETAATG